MKTCIYALAFVVSFIACKESDSKQINLSKSNTGQVKESSSTSDKLEGNSTYLCRINKKKWGYTKASGILSKNKKTGKKTAIITFTKKLNKGTESIQLFYDGNTFKLESAIVRLKFPKKGGGPVNAVYSLYPDTRSKYPQSDLLGTINLSNPTKASGNATLTKFNIQWEKDLLESPENDAIITVKDLNFENIFYTDPSKLFQN